MRENVHCGNQQRRTGLIKERTRSKHSKRSRNLVGSGSEKIFETNTFWRCFPSGMRRRWWLFRPFDLLARFWPLFKRRNGLVVVRMDGIGDMVLFRNSLDHYSSAFNVKKKDITIIGCKSWGGLLSGLFIGYKTISIDEHSYGKNLHLCRKSHIFTRKIIYSMGNMLIYKEQILFIRILIFLWENCIHTL